MRNKRSISKTPILKGNTILRTNRRWILWAELFLNNYKWNDIQGVHCKICHSSFRRKEKIAETPQNIYWCWIFLNTIANKQPDILRWDLRSIDISGFYSIHFDASYHCRIMNIKMLLKLNYFHIELIRY